MVFAQKYFDFLGKHQNSAGHGDELEEGHNEKLAFQVQVNGRLRVHQFHGPFESVH